MLNSIKEKRQSEILKLFKIVEESGLSIKKYFESHDTPICIKQYSRLKKRYAQQGVAGLVDQRHAGNARKIKLEEIKLVHGTLAYNRNLTSQALQAELQNQWGVSVGQRRIEQIRQEFNLTRIKSKTIKQETLQFAGIEIFSALAHHVGILAHWNTTIQQRLQEVTKMQSQKANRGADHIRARHRDGTFSPRYNRLASVCRTKFASITDKVKNKDFSRLSLSQIKADNLTRKNLAVLFQYRSA